MVVLTVQVVRTKNVAKNTLAHLTNTLVLTASVSQAMLDVTVSKTAKMVQTSVIVNNIEFVMTVSLLQLHNRDEW